MEAYVSSLDILCLDETSSINPPLVAPIGISLFVIKKT